MEAFIASDNAREEMELVPEDPAAAIPEWEMDYEEGDGEVAAPQPIVKIVTVRYSRNCRTWTVAALFDLYQRYQIGTSLRKTAGKRLIFDAIRDSSFATKIDDDTFTYEMEEIPEHLMKGPKWKILDGVEIDLPEDFDPSGVTAGFFAPTNKDNYVGQPKKEYLVDRPLQRPEFCPKPKKASNSNRPGRPSRTDTTTQTANETGGPSDHVKSKLPKDFSSHRPKHYFDLQITPEFIRSNIVNTTNFRAAAEGAAGSTYQDFVPFDVDEVYKFLGLLFCNGVSPKPQFVYWFLGRRQSKVFGNDWFSTFFDKRLPGGRVIKGERRWNHFRRFMCLYDYRLNPREQQKKNPLWKLDPILDHLRKNAQRCWTTGKFVAIDEQTIGFKGKHSLALRITYKREGDGYQCDAVCDDGYTFSFYFRHGDAPAAPDSVKHLDLSPTGRRVIWLMLQLPNLWTRVYMDNLFNSRKLYTAAWICKTLCQGVCRTWGRGVPEKIVQKTEPDVAKAGALRGRTMVAVLEGDDSCPDLLCCSVYDTKPVHMMSTIAEKVEWIEMTRDVYSQELKCVVPMKYLRLNMIDDYNHRMNSVDLADQLRNCYRFNHWFRNRKWWWAIFLWAVGVAATNAYKMYCAVYDEERAKHEVGLPRKWTHLEFLLELIDDFFGCPQTSTDRSVVTTASSSRTRHGSTYSSADSANQNDTFYDLSTEAGRLDYFNLVKPTSMTKKRIECNTFASRFDGKFHPELPNPSPEAYCQYCRYKFNMSGMMIKKGRIKSSSRIELAL
jgi:hypothetical protein